MSAVLPLEQVSTALKTDAVRARLRRKFCAPEYGLLEEVRNGTGFTAFVRSADCLVMSLWPSRGLTLSGVEIKISRNDWLRELKKPEKADLIASYCDYWYVAVGDKDIIKDGELPETWGLIIPRGDEMVIWKQPAKLTPVPVDRTFLAAMFRRASESSASAVQISAACDVAVADARKAFKKHAKWQIENAETNARELKAAVAEFQEKSGVDINRYNAGRIGDAVRFVLAGGAANAEQRLLEIQRQVDALHSDLKKTLDALKITKAVVP